MIAAMTRNRVIGKNNDIPWHLPDDFKYFKEMTRGHFVLMGRKNFDSLPDKFKPLPDRPNVIITHKSAFDGKGAYVVHSLEEALGLARSAGEQEAFIIGGGEIYRQGLEISDRIYLTEIATELAGDVFFPEFDLSQWEESLRNHHSADDRHKFAFDFVIYDKK